MGKVYSNLVDRIFVVRTRRRGVADRVEDGLELAFTGAGLHRFLIKVVERLVQVRKNTSRRFICNLDRVLKNTLRHVVSLSSTSWLSRKIHSEGRVRSNCVGFKKLLQSWEPLGYQMNILEDNPVTFFSGKFHSLFGDNFLTLTEGNVVEVSFVKGESDLFTNGFDVLKRIDTRRENEEASSSRAGLFVRSGKWNSSVLGILGMKLFSDELGDSVSHSIRSETTHHAQLLERSLALPFLRELLLFGTF